MLRTHVHISQSIHLLHLLLFDSVDKIELFQNSSQARLLEILKVYRLQDYFLYIYICIYIYLFIYLCMQNLGQSGNPPTCGPGTGNAPAATGSYASPRDGWSATAAASPFINGVLDFWGKSTENHPSSY